MAFTFTNTSNGDTVIITVPPKEPEKIIATKPQYITKISNLPKLQNVIMMAYRRSHPKLKRTIHVTFASGVCRVYFEDSAGNTDYFSVPDVEKKRIAVK